MSAHRARKRFGQHFLTDPAVIEAIVRAFEPRPGDAIVEIGPGLGALTKPLAERAGELTVIELDRDLAARLRHDRRLRVIESDVLRVDFAALAQERGQLLRVIGSLPYNVSTPILFHLQQSIESVRDQCFMLQKEVVDRMGAAPGSRTYGRLSVMLQWRCRVEPLFDVPASAFEPPPRVDSAVVSLVPRLDAPALDRALLEQVVTSAFSQRRKLLRHTLGRWIEARGLGDCGFELKRRAEEVPVADYVALARAAARIAG